MIRSVIQIGFYWVVSSFDFTPQWKLRGFYETAPAWPTAVWLALPGPARGPGGLGLGLGLGLGGLGGLVWAVWVVWVAGLGGLRTSLFWVWVV